MNVLVEPSPSSFIKLTKKNILSFSFFFPFLFQNIDCNSILTNEFCVIFFLRKVKTAFGQVINLNFIHLNWNVLKKRNYRIE